MAGVMIERLTGGAKDVVDDGRRGAAFGPGREARGFVFRLDGLLLFFVDGGGRYRCALHLLLFLTGGAHALEGLARRHPHHPVRHAVSFLFVLVAGLVDSQLGLDAHGERAPKRSGGRRPAFGRRHRRRMRR
jgi:hypothetical protein